MEANQEYFVFISYSSLDNEWAIWLRDELEHYHLPASFNGRTDVRDNLRKVFRDRDELSAGPEWDEQVNQALANTNNLIVICSPNAAKSDAVNKEVETFVALGKEDHIFPFIVEGEPKDCFPPALKHSKLGGDIKKDGGSNAAFIKVVSGMLKVGFPSLWERYEREKAEEERKIREQRDNLLRVQSRFLAEKADILVNEGDSYTARLLALEALPKDLENPDRPFVPEVEAVLRRSMNNTAILKGHNDGVSSLSCHPNKKIFASGACDKRIIIWDLISGSIIKILEGHTDNIERVEFSHNGKYLLSASADNSIIIWDTDNWKIKKKLSVHSNIVSSARFTPNDKFIVSASEDCTIKIIDINTCQVVITFIGHENGVNDAIMSPDSRWIYSSSSDWTIRKWDAKSGKEIFTIELYEVITLPIALSPDGKYLATISEGNMIYKNRLTLYQTVDGEEVTRRYGSMVNYFKSGHKSFINSINYSFDGRFIVTASADNDIKIWNVKTGEEIPWWSWGHTDNVSCAVFVPHYNLILSSSQDQTIRIWDPFRIGCKREIEVHDRRIDSIDYDNTGEFLLSVSDNVDIWNANIGNRIQSIELDNSPISQALFSNDGHYLVLSVKNLLVLFEKKQISPNSSSYLKEKELHKSCNIVSFSINIKDDITVALENGEIECWNISFTILKYRNTVNDKRLNGAICSSDGERIVYIVGNSISIIEVSSNEIIGKLEGHMDSINCISFNSDEQYIVSGAEDNTIRIWDLTCYSEVLCIKESNNVTSVSFSPDDKYILSATGYEWNSANGNTKVWNAEDGMLISLLESFEGLVNYAKFNRKGTMIASARSDGVVKIWDWNNLETIMSETRERFKNRQLTTEERKKYYLD